MSLLAISLYSTLKDNSNANSVVVNVSFCDKGSLYRLQPVSDGIGYSDLVNLNLMVSAISQ